MVKLLLRIYSAIHAVIAVMFAVVALALIVISAKVGWEALTSGLTAQAAVRQIETIGLIAVAVVSLQMAQTITEEEVVREEHISAPTRVRRFLSRFMVVVVVALVVEGLVATIKALHEDMTHLVGAAAPLVAAALLLAGWGVFVYLNAFAEQLEPEAMQKAKDEDAKLE
jgi:hypothetical protein